MEEENAEEEQAEEVQTEKEKAEVQLNNKEALDKETQTDSELQNQCVCNDLVVKNRLLMQEDRIICSFKKADMNAEEWEDIEETVKQSEVELDDMLEDYSKIMEGYWRLENKERKLKE